MVRKERAIMRTWTDIDKEQTVATEEELSIVDTLSFLEAQRIKQGITQSEFARRIGMSHHNWQKQKVWNRCQRLRH